MNHCLVRLTSDDDDDDNDDDNDDDHDNDDYVRCDACGLMMHDRKMKSLNLELKLNWNSERGLGANSTRFWCKSTSWCSDSGFTMDPCHS